MALTTHLYLVPRLKRERAIPLLPLCTFMAGYWVNFIFTVTYKTFFFYNICVKDIEDHVVGFIPILQLYGVMLHGYILYKQYKVPACIGVNRNAYRVLVRKPEGSNHLEQLWVYGKMLLKWMCRK